MKPFWTKPRSSPPILPLAFAILLVGGAALAKAPEQKYEPLPAPSVTEQSIEIGGRKLGFKATASAVPVKDARSGEVLAEIATLAFTVEPPKAEAGGGGGAACRPIVFAVNGGPGAGSAWLNLGAIGPWRLPFAGAVPSTPPRLVDNQESWLDFADLVFLDPPGTGYSRLPTNEAARKRFLSVDGDIDMLAVVIRRWTVREHRQACPKYLLGESYGGFRAPKIVRVLQEKENIGMDGLILLSPVLDFSWIHGRNNPLLDASRLPSLVASHTGAKDRAALAEAEAYAQGDYLADLLRGPRDKAALERIVSRLSAMTGLAPEKLRRLGGRVSAEDWTRDSDPSGRTVASFYDGATRGLSPDPRRPPSEWADPVLDALRAPLAEAMEQVVTGRLKWPVGDSKYEILNDKVSESWDWGHGRLGQESLSDLHRVMALDPRIRVLVALGLNDLVTPYFGTCLLLAQSADIGSPERIDLLALAGGHMFYAEDGSRAAFRDAARKMIEGK
ncbi:peptidase S10 [Rhodoblastus acidophilus]|uniref:Peptidase S10 n=1 Tax=Candidatus Rhodoblastus alkanivorans TaxID=2954117 RepID=A0ABS9Z669_9HYPH|nr:peptidase S10 [Candidatus Rhodoblastus alkanivorans]MCI4678417.1 peptidase S10 [Candidatus Rhodoblastus alkanivorans]MCI4682910.1 peptidase S10 [Candidatus Rhodoblastus alkanivorans]MDI4640220.1 peptidase S10 [Rhodoblastus acidophilus]